MQLLMRILKASFGVLVALTLVSFVFPSKFGAKRELVIAASADKIYPLLADPRQWEKWSPWLEADPKMKIQYSGAPSGVGAQWSWTSEAEGNGSMKFEAAEPNKRLAYTMVFSSGTPASGEFLLTPQEGGRTKVTWSFAGETGYNPIARWFGLVMDKLVGPYFQKGLANLAKVVQTAP
jgi:uncharacterized protein YndB with AHSA1/START domain